VSRNGDKNPQAKQKGKKSSTRSTRIDRITRTKGHLLVKKTNAKEKARFQGGTAIPGSDHRDQGKRQGSPVGRTDANDDPVGKKKPADQNRKTNHTGKEVLGKQGVRGPCQKNRKGQKESVQSKDKGPVPTAGLKKKKTCRTVWEVKKTLDKTRATRKTRARTPKAVFAKTRAGGAHNGQVPFAGFLKETISPGAAPQKGKGGKGWKEGRWKAELHP